MPVIRTNSSVTIMGGSVAEDAGRLEARLRAAELRRRCLVELGDRLRGCEFPSQIAGAVSEVLGRALGCLRTGYAVIRGEHAVVESDWSEGEIAPLSGPYEFASLGPIYLSYIRRGEMLVVADMLSHPATSGSADKWSALGVRALLNVPLLDNGIPVGLLYAHEAQLRDWTDDDVSLVKEVADRTWEAMGRARAVEALRRVNATLEGQVRARTLQLDRMWTLSSDIMMVSDFEGNILSVNPAWSILLGWRPDELIGSAFYTFLHPDDVSRTRTERHKVERGERIDKLENRYRTKAGGYVWLSWKAVPDGDVVHSVARDVTAEREQAGALQAAEEALRHAQKMEAVGQLTGGIAHDFNNLLQGILGSLSLAQKRIAQGRIDGLAEYTAQAITSAERATALTHRLLAFSRRQPLDPKPVDANALVMAMEPLLRRTLGESIRLEFGLAPDLWRTLCDPNQLDSAILNLAINARDAMPHGGTLTIRTSNVPCAGGPALDAPEVEQICVSVTDTGTGMPPDVMARAFDPFYTTKPIGQGTGLGLSMVYGFMQQSGGEAKIESALNEGTTVSLFLRRHHGKDCADDARPVDASAPASAARGQGSVLVLEDEFVVRTVIVELLEELGFQIIEAGDGPSGLQILQSAQRIDLLVTDIGLPGLNGRQVAEAARLIRPDLKVLFMTGYADSAIMRDGFLAAGMEMITKPFAVEVLAKRVRNMIEG
jgi:PAS domain S-box-containing protein